MSDDSPFDIASLVAKPKGKDDDTNAVDQTAEKLGFVNREPVKPRRRRRPRSGQVGNPKVYPEYAEAFRDEASGRGISHGALFEEMWRDYCAAKGLTIPD